MAVIELAVDFYNKYDLFLYHSVIRSLLSYQSIISLQ